MFPRRAKRKKLVLVALLGLTLLLLSSCRVMTARASVFQETPTPSPSPTAGPPQQPPSNIPVYPGATFVQTEKVTFGHRPGVAWVYTVSGATLTLADVTRFYQEQMPMNGWEQAGSVVPENGTGTYNATLLFYQMPQQQPPTPTPSSTPSHHKEMAIIAAGVNNQANPHDIGFVIATVK